jgi:hypothetical protein
VNGAPGALRARKTWRTLEPLHGMVYFVPEAASEYARLGITGQSGYFASRAAPMGEVGPDVVVSTFYNFNPDAVAAAIPSSWGAASPTALLRARLDAADAAFRRILGDDVLGSTEMARAASLARLAAEEVAGISEGRPLAAAHAALSWPEQQHLVLWHAQSVLREYRGDGHVALLVTHGLSGLEALVTHAASGEVSAQVLRSTRQWSEDAWKTAVVSLQDRDWLEPGDDLRLTTWGAGQRQEIEDRTDELASAPYEVLGDEGCDELRALARPWSRTVAALLF